MIDWIDVAGGVLEMIEISIIILGFNQEHHFSKTRIIAFLLPSITILPLINSFDIPYHAFVTVGMVSIFAWLILKIDWIYAFTDAITGFVGGLLFQLLASIVITLISKGVAFPEELGMFTALTLMVLTAYLIVKNVRVQEFLTEHYYPNRKIILWIWVTILIVSALVINLWSPEQTLFSNQRIELLVIVGLYILLNSVFIYSLFKNRKTEKKLFEAREYEDYLHEMMDQMRSKEHEYKNHIHHIISIAESEQIEDKDKEIIKYGNQLIKRYDGQTKKSTTDNITISIFLFQAEQRAEKEKVNFEYYVDKPFPEYHIPENDLVELVSNAINNAFEAESTLDPEQRNVFISFQTGRIEVMNTIIYMPDVPYGVSTKGSGRGYGRLNMKRIADKYGIKIETEIEDNVFIVSMTFK